MFEKSTRLRVKSLLESEFANFTELEKVFEYTVLIKCVFYMLILILDIESRPSGTSTNLP